ncbi:acyltransferase domain-containing protein [Streptomyces sp. NPDC057702]|uniref:acyltransferase domain-containing protein n=1 Tax=unclassified Streptomyces TaxID=2593676 RepID=UPI00369162AD
MRNIVYLLGGQGSQYFGMASSLYRDNVEFRRTVDRLDAVCTGRGERSVVDYLYDSGRGLSDPCDDLALSNAAIFMVEYALSELLRTEGLRPDVLVGSSLGEFSAMAIAGYVPAEAALGFVIEMAHLLEGRLRPGGMIAVLGDPRLYEELPVLHQHTEVASVNHDGHFVLSGEATGLRIATEALRDRGLITVALPVHFAFHSSALDGLRDPITELAASLTFDTTADPAVTRPLLISSTTTDVVKGWHPEDCWSTLRRPIAFTRALSAVPDAARAQYVDLTPSSTLAAIMKTSHPELRTHPVITPFGTEPARLESLRADLL